MTGLVEGPLMKHQMPVVAPNLSGLDDCDPKRPNSHRSGVCERAPDGRRLPLFRPNATGQPGRSDGWPAGVAYGHEMVSRSGSGSVGELCQISRGGPTGTRPASVIQQCSSS